MLRPTRRLAVRMAKIPQLARPDQPAHAILSEPARSPTRTPHRPRRNPATPHRATRRLIPVLHSSHRVANPLPTKRRTEPLVPHRRHVLAAAQLAKPRPRRHPPPPRRPRPPTPRPAIDLIAVHHTEKPATTLTSPISDPINHAAPGERKIPSGGGTGPAGQKKLSPKPHRVGDCGESFDLVLVGV